MRDLRVECGHVLTNVLALFFPYFVCNFGVPCLFGLVKNIEIDGMTFPPCLCQNAILTL